MLHSEVLDEEVAHNVSAAQALAITPVAARRSSVYLSKFEVARIVGERARQIVNGAALHMTPPPLVQPGSTSAAVAMTTTTVAASAYTRHGYSGGAGAAVVVDVAEAAERCPDAFSLTVDPVMAAKRELLQRAIPMIVRRTWPDGTVENIPVRELLVDAAMLDV